MICPNSERMLDTLSTPTRTDSTLTKPNDLLVMVPVVGKLTPVTRKLFNALLLVGGTEYRARLNAGTPMGAEERFEARLSDLVAHLPGEASDWSRNAQEHILEMFRVEVIWESIDRNAGISKLEAMHLIEDVVVEKRGNTVHVQWRFPITVLSYLKDPAFFTRLDLEVIGSLRTYAAISLYEICSRYKTNPSGLTCSQTPEWWVEALTARSVRPPPPKGRGRNAVEVEPDQKPRREWRKVKSESVLDAIEEINGKTDLEIELIEKRVGKAVAEVQFAVRRKRRALAAAEPGIAPDLLEKAVSLGIAASDIVTIVRSVRGGPDVVRAALVKLSERVAREDLVPLSNVTAYLKTILSELDEYVGTSDSKAPSAPDRIKQTGSSIASRLSPPMMEVVDVSETPESIARKQIEALERPVQEDLAKSAFEGMQNKGLATAAVVQAYAKYRAGGPLAGVLLGEMTRQYLANSAQAVA
jgi:hypothetical protein